MGRAGFVVQRLLLLIPVAVGVTIVVFFMVHLIPGDPAATILGIHATPKAVALLHQQWGLNRPLASQYWLFLDRLLHGNLGQSIFYGGSVTSLILSHLPPTLWLLTYATVLTVLISVPLAVLAASRRDGIRDHVVRAVPLVGLGMPPFWLGFLLIYGFAISLRLFPVSGYGAGFTGHLVSRDALSHCPVTHLVECHLDFVEGVIKVGDAQTRGALAKPKVRAAVRDKGSANAIAKRAVRRFVRVIQLFENSPRVGGHGLGMLVDPGAVDPIGNLRQQTREDQSANHAQEAGQPDAGLEHAFSASRGDSLRGRCFPGGQRGRQGVPSRQCGGECAS